MIVEVKVTVFKCPKCGSDKLVKNGHDYKGAQKYRCDSCGRYGTLDKKTPRRENSTTSDRRLP